MLFPHLSCYVLNKIIDVATLKWLQQPRMRTLCQRPKSEGEGRPTVLTYRCRERRLVPILLADWKLQVSFGQVQLGEVFGIHSHSLMFARRGLSVRHVEGQFKIFSTCLRCPRERALLIRTSLGPSVATSGMTDMPS